MLDQHLDVRALDEQRRRRPVQVALAVRRVLEQLAVAGQVALRRRDVAVGLDGVERAPALHRRHPPVGRRARDDDVVAGAASSSVAEDGLDGGRAGLDVDALVADRVAVERATAHAGDDVGESARRRCRARSRRPVTASTPVAPSSNSSCSSRWRGVSGWLGARPGRAAPTASHVDDRRRDAAVVEQRRVGGEALLPHQLLVVQVPLGGAVLGVPLGRDAAGSAVVRHVVSSVWSAH